MKEITSKVISESIAPITVKAFPGNDHYMSLVLVASDIVEILITLAFPDGGDELAEEAIAAVRCNKIPEFLWARVHMNGINFWGPEKNTTDNIIRRHSYDCLEDLISCAEHSNKMFYESYIEQLRSLIDAKAITICAGNNPQKRIECEKKILEILERRFQEFGLKILLRLKIGLIKNKVAGLSKTDGRPRWDRID